jgi:hypothetical protein
MDRMTKSIVAIVATIAVLAICFFAYDLLKPVVSPCDTIFQQTTASLGSKLEILKAKGEIFIGKEKIQDLTERAQITALNLKTCCVVLDAGAVNSDQFLQCQGSARGYGQQIEAAAAQAGEANMAQQQGQTDLVEAKVRAINDSLTAAQQQSQLLQQTLVQLTQPSAPLLAPGSTPLLAPSDTPTSGAAAGQQAQAAPRWTWGSSLIFGRHAISSEIRSALLCVTLYCRRSGFPRCGRAPSDHRGYVRRPAGPPSSLDMGFIHHFWGPRDFSVESGRRRHA